MPLASYIWHVSGSIMSACHYLGDLISQMAHLGSTFYCNEQFLMHEPLVGMRT
jgi:hypothetical protein